jgi:starch phosphorylase
MQAHRKGLRLLENGASGARELVQWETKIRSKWDAVKIMTEKYDSPGVLRSGEKVNVTVLADLAGLEPDDVAVELLYGKLNQFGKIQNGRVTEMEFLERSGSYDRFVAAIPCTYSGRHGFSVRIRPDHPLMTSRFYPYLLKWEE